MKVLSLFSGIGAFEKALDRLNIDYELVAFSEIDKYATKSYCAIHGVDESMNLGDITKVDENSLPKDIDLITYGFPCQDISLAGKQKGLFNNDGTQTRSGLFFEALRIIEATKPKIAIAENVKNLTGKKFKEQFELVLKSLEEAGYSNYWKVLNAKDYGIPQNRERVFIISIRKDIDKGYEFPKPFPLQLRLKDMLDDEVDEKFYLSLEQMGKIVNWKAHQKPFEHVNGDNSIVQTLKIIVREATKKGYAEAVEGDSVNIGQPNSKTRRGRVGKQVSQTLTTSPQQCVVTNKTICLNSKGGRGGVEGLQPSLKDRIYDSNGIATACTTSEFFLPNYTTKDLRIRKLTPKERWRLMGFDDEDFYKAEAVNSNTQLYKQAGNSIVVDVIVKIYEKLFERYGGVIK